MTILDYINKPTIQNYENLIDYYGNRVKLLMNESNNILDWYYADKYVLDDELKNKFFNNNDNKYIIYGFPYIGSSRNTYLKDSKNSRVKTFEYIDNKFVDVKTKNKFYSLNNDLNYTNNLDLANDLDNIAKLIKSIKNINTLKELPSLMDSIEESLLRIINTHHLKEKCVLYFESDSLNVLEKIQNKFSQNLIQNFCKEDDYEYLEIEFNDNYYDTLNMLKSFGFEKIKYNYENENFSFKFEGKPCTLDIHTYYSIEEFKNLKNEINHKDSNEDYDFDR